MTAKTSLGSFQVGAHLSLLAGFPSVDGSDTAVQKQIMVYKINNLSGHSFFTQFSLNRLLELHHYTYHVPNLLDDQFIQLELILRDKSPPIVKQMLTKPTLLTMNCPLLEFSISKLQYQLSQPAQTLYS